MKNFFRRLNLGYLISESFSEHKRCYIGLTISTVVGIIVGIGLAANGSVTFINVSVTKHYSITVGIGVAGVFLRRMFSYLICLGLLMVFSLHVAMCPGHFLLTMLRGYYFGALCVLLVYQFGFSGVMCVIFALIPAQLIHLVILIVAGTYGITCSFKFRRYGCLSDMRGFLIFFGVCYAAALIGTLLECLLIALIVNPLFI